MSKVSNLFFVIFTVFLVAKMTYLPENYNGKSTMDVFPVENGDFPACHVIVFTGVYLNKSVFKCARVDQLPLFPYI